MKAGRLPGKGLCGSLPGDGLLKLFAPHSHLSLFLNNWYWGYDGEIAILFNAEDLRYEITDFRKTILLFMAAINNEL
jgi:hypothetical protein